jgi:hypothetical protein
LCLWGLPQIDFHSNRVAQTRHFTLVVPFLFLRSSEFATMETHFSNTSFLKTTCPPVHFFAMTRIKTAGFNNNRSSLHKRGLVSPFTKDKYLPERRRSICITFFPKNCRIKYLPGVRKTRGWKLDRAINPKHVISASDGSVHTKPEREETRSRCGPRGHPATIKSAESLKKLSGGHSMQIATADIKKTSLVSQLLAI